MKIWFSAEMQTLILCKSLEIVKLCFHRMALYIIVYTKLDTTEVAISKQCGVFLNKVLKTA